MRYFCTYFDRNYLVRGLTLYRSLLKHAEPFTLWVLCFDDFTYTVLSNLNQPNLKPIKLSDFENDDTALLKAKENRSTVEYYFTCSPSLLLYILNKWPEVDVLSYLDADLFFYSAPDPIYREFGDASILIIPHRHPAEAQHLEKSFGIYNVGLLTFRNDQYALECLQWWRERCLEWCYDRIEDGRFADQKYLDDWPTRFQRVVVLQHKGANLAPWNWMNYKIEMRNGSTTVDGQPLIFYHFHGLKVLSKRLYDIASAGEYQPMPGSLKHLLYPGYMRELKTTEAWVRQWVSEAVIGHSSIRTGAYGLRGLVRKLLSGEVMIDYSLR
jgi:hypothetical protein